MPRNWELLLTNKPCPLVVEYGTKSNFLSLILTRPLRGEIHSVFQTSFNIRIQHSLIHIGALGTPLSAFGINIPQSVLQKFLVKLKAGMPIIYQAGYLQMDTADQPFIIRLDKLSSIDLNMKPLRIRKEWLEENEIIKAIKKIDFVQMTGIIQVKQDSAILERLTNADPTDAKIAAECMAHFFGRGIGLTPSGDDFLSGILMVEAFFTDHAVWKNTLKRFLKNHITTDVSYSYYDCLLNGYVSENFKNLFCNISIQVDKTKAKRLIKNVTNYGHTSGYDTLFGILTALHQNYWRIVHGKHSKKEPSC